MIRHCPPTIIAAERFDKTRQQMTVEKYKCMLDDISLLLLRLVSGKILKILFSFKLFPVGRQVEFKSMLDLTGDGDF